MSPADLQRRALEIAPALPERPGTFGAPAADRAAWDALAAQPFASGVLARARGLASQPIPETSDTLYLEFSRTGNRTHWQAVASKRRGRVQAFALAEALEGRGRFVAPFEEAVRALCAERTWVMPAHDRSLANFEGRTVDIDLGSSALAAGLAVADRLLADRLGPECRALIAEHVRRRALVPFADMAAGRRPANFWLTGQNNWNAVCLSYALVAALEQLPSREERAFALASTEHYVRNFLKGFTPDGYCSEGLGYWNYGFGHFALLAEAMRQATGGRADPLLEPAARAPAEFANRIEIRNGVYPAFADCSVTAQPDADLMAYLSRRFGWGLAAWESRATDVEASLPLTLMYLFPNAASDRPASAAPGAGPGLRSWFADAGVLVARPAPGAAARLAVALKGGHNAEHHNHDDVGSYVVVAGAAPVLLDPGAEVYTARTFGAKRYDSDLLNSWGHPVPLVAGAKQRTGRDAAARVLRAEFTDRADTLALDLRAAYEVPSLRRLERTFAYDRTGAGALDVVDVAEFDAPQSFETALVTQGAWTRPGPGRLRVEDRGEAVEVAIDAGGAAFEVVEEPIRDDSRPKRVALRLAIRPAAPAARFRIALRITPAAAAR